MLKGKLKQDQGVALINALMFFLFCAMVATIVVTAAAANAGKAAKMREEQQEYLSVRSAAQLMTDMMSSGSFEGYYTAHDEEIIQTIIKDDGTPQITVTHKITVLSASTGYNAVDIGVFPAELVKYIGNFYLQTTQCNGVYLLTVLDGANVSNNVLYQVPTELKVTLQVQVETDLLPPVSLTLQISKGDGTRTPYSATITAVSKSGNYKLILDGVATATTTNGSRDVSSGSNKITEITSTTEIKWGNWTVRKAGAVT